MRRRDLLRSLHRSEISRRSFKRPADPLPREILRTFWRAWREERKGLKTWQEADKAAQTFEAFARERLGELPASFAADGGAIVVLRGAKVEKGWPVADVAVHWPSGHVEEATIGGAKAGLLAPPTWLHGDGGPLAA